MGKNIAVMIWSLYSGGAERVAGLLSLFLAKENNVYVLVLDDSNRVYAYGGQLISIKQKSLEWGLRYDQTVEKLKKNLEIDVSISFLEGMNALNICSRIGETVIISERCTQSRMIPTDEMTNITIQKLYNYADAIVACSHGVKFDLVNYYNQDENKISVIYNLVDVNTIKSKCNEGFENDVEKFISGAEYYINVGRLDKQKNQKNLIEEFSIFLKNYNNRKLVIFGNGEEYIDLVHRIKELNLEKQIKIFQYCNNPFKYIKRAKALIVSSLYEGLPNVILEAMVLGCPIVSADSYSGPRELLLGINDYSAPIDDLCIGERGIVLGDWKRGLEHLNYARALSYVEENSELVLKMKNNGLRYMDKYPLTDIEEKWKDLINNTLSSKKKCPENPYEVLSKANKIYIYGAGIVGKRLYSQMKDKYPVAGYIVTKLDQEYDCNSLVVQIDDVDLSDNPTIVVGVGHKYVNEVLNILKEKKVKNIVYFHF